MAADVTNHQVAHECGARHVADVDEEVEQRKEQLEKVLRGVMDIEMALAKIKGLAESKNPWGAWEEVREARDDFGDDIELLKLSEELSEDVSNFIGVLRKAERCASSATST